MWLCQLNLVRCFLRNTQIIENSIAPLNRLGTRAISGMTMFKTFLIYLNQTITATAEPLTTTATNKRFCWINVLFFRFGVIMCYGVVLAKAYVSIANACKINFCTWQELFRNFISCKIISKEIKAIAYEDGLLWEWFFPKLGNLIFVDYETLFPG